MSERDAFLAAILESPDDDGPRLIFADYLEENGDPARGEFIRIQCAIARLPAGKWEVVSDPGGEMHRVRWSVPDEEGRYQWVRHYPRKHFAERQADDFNAGRATPYFEQPLPEPGAALRARERELWNTVPLGLGVWPGLLLCPAGSVPENDRSYATVRRGFVEQVTCACADWLDFGPAICAAHPVTRVTLSDKRPYHEHGRWMWFSTEMLALAFPEPSPSSLPLELLDNLRDGRWTVAADHRAYDNAESPLSDLSAACLAFARPRVPAPG